MPIHQKHSQTESPAQLHENEELEGRSSAAPAFGLSADAPSMPSDNPNTQNPFQLHGLGSSVSTASPAPFQLKSNDTGLPDTLKSGVEQLSGQSLDDVRVQFNSPQPAQMQAHAFARGSEIHVAPGQEQHLPEEAWHVTQQKEGRVQANTQINGQPVNDNEGLESEARNMGAKAAQMKVDPAQLSAEGFSAGPRQRGSLGQGVTQRAGTDGVDIFTLILWAVILLLGIGAFAKYKYGVTEQVVQKPEVQEKAKKVLGNSGPELESSKKEDKKTVEEIPAEHKEKVEELGSKINKEVEQAVSVVKGSSENDLNKESNSVSEPESLEQDLNKQEGKNQKPDVVENGKDLKKEEDVLDSSEKDLLHEVQPEIIEKEKSSEEKPEDKGVGLSPQGKQYLDGIRVNKNWGGYLEAHAMAENYGLRTAIYYQDQNDLVRLDEIGPGNGTRLEFSLFWTGNHYQLIRQDSTTARVPNWNGNIFYDPPGNGNCLYTAFAYLAEVDSNIEQDPRRGQRLLDLKDRYENDLPEWALNNKAMGAREAAHRQLSANPMLANLAGSGGLNGKKEDRKDSKIEQDVLHLALLTSVVYQELPWKEWKLENRKNKGWSFVKRENDHVTKEIEKELNKLFNPQSLGSVGDSSFVNSKNLDKSLMKGIVEALITDPNYNQDASFSQKESEKGEKKDEKDVKPKNFDNDLSFDVTLDGFPLRFVIEKDLLNAMLDDGVPYSELSSITWSKSSGKGSWNVIKPRSGDKSKAFELKVWGGKGKTGDYGCDRWRTTPGDYDKDPKNKKVRQVLTFKSNTGFNEK